MARAVQNGCTDVLLPLSTTGDYDLDEKIKQWRQLDQNVETQNCIRKLVAEQNLEELRSRLFGRLSFGTAGMRAEMGAGFNRMNDLTVIQTTQGILGYLLKKSASTTNFKSKSVIIGYDGRRNSKRFALLVANVFLLQNIKVYLFSKVVPTPFVSFGVIECGCELGIMITASHNPKQDNGYKVYWNNGAQIISPCDKRICAEILEHLVPVPGVWDTSKVETHPLCTDPLQNVTMKYCAEAREHFCFYRELNSKCPLKFTYTAFHGVGGYYTPEVIKQFCFTEDNLVLVQEQLLPDPEFPTVKCPNPEEGSEVLELSFETADKTGSCLVVANDPDADRLQIAEKQKNGEWRVFTGNEMGALLAWWVWHGWRKRNPEKSGKDVYILNSAVSSKISQSIAEIEGFNFEETLTGFKWMGNRTHELRKLGKTVLLAWEESIGFMPGNTLDKDGVLSAAMFCECAAYLHENGRDLADQLEVIYQRYGYHLNRSSYVICKDPEKTKQIFHRIRNFGGKNKFPDMISRYAVRFVRDLTVGFDNSQPDNKPTLPVSESSQMVTFTLENGSWVTLRTSGTEPKIKYYLELKTEAGRNWTADLLDGLRTELRNLELTVVEFLIQPAVHGLEFVMH